MLSSQELIKTGDSYVTLERRASIQRGDSGKSLNSKIPLAPLFIPPDDYSSNNEQGHTISATKIKIGNMGSPFEHNSINTVELDGKILEQDREGSSRTPRQTEGKNKFAFKLMVNTTDHRLEEQDISN